MAADPSRLRPLLRELQIVTAGLPAAIDEHLAGLTAALAAATEEADTLRRRLSDITARAVQAETAADENGRAADAAERALATAHADADRLRTALASAEAEIARLRTADAHPQRDVAPQRPAHPRARAAAPAATLTLTGPVDPRPALSLTDGTPPSAALAAEASTPAARLAETFRAWCGEATPVMGKVEFFAGRARTALPGASVTAVYRDANSQATPVALSTQGAASPVEHWLVALDGRHWLLPQPMAAAQFRELAPCFEGTATPATLATVVPAEVRVVGDRYEVPAPGHVG